MAKTYDVTSPDGKTFEVTAPDDATPEQVMAYAQSQFKAPPSTAEKAVSVLKGVYDLTPAGLGVAAVKKAEHALQEGAYAAGGSVTDATGSPAAGYAANVGIQAIPTILGGGIGSAAGKGLQAAGRSLMQSALKPPLKALESGKGQAAAETLLKEGINPTAGGVEKLNTKIDALNNQITTALSQSGATVNKGEVASRIQDVVKRVERSNPTPNDAIRDVEKVYNEFLANGLVPKQIPVQQAQALKQGIYKMLKDKYGTLGSDTVEAQKALARGFKETLSKEVPEIAKLNAKESELLTAVVLAQRRALMSGNANPTGLATLATNPQAAAAFLADRSPLFKSLFARMLYSGSKAGTAAGATTGGAVGMVSGQE